MKLRNLVLPVLVVGGLFTAYMGVFKVNEGQIGIEKCWGRVVAEQSPGTYWTTPFVCEVERLSSQVQDNEVIVDALTKDEQQLNVKIKVQYAIAPQSKSTAGSLVSRVDGENPEQMIGDATYIYINFGSRAKFETAVMDNQMAKVVTDAVGKQKLEAIVGDRAKFVRGIEKELVTILNAFPIDYTEGNIQVTKISPSKEYSAAVERKQVAEKDAERKKKEAVGIETEARAMKKKRELLAEGEAFAVTAAANAEANAITVKANAEAGAITARSNALKAADDKYLQLEYLEAWDGKRSMVVSGDSQGVDFGIGSTIGKTVAETIVK